MLFRSRLSYVVNHDVMRAALQNFYARTGVQLGADAADGYQIPPGVPAPDFCLLLQNFGRCELGHSTASLNGEIPQLRFDGAQVAHLVIPIRDNSHALGRLISEPFAVASPDFPTVYELARSLPALTAVPPLASLVIGRLILHEAFHFSAAAIPLAVVSLVATIAGLIALARSPLAGPSPAIRVQ